MNSKDRQAPAASQRPTESTEDANERLASAIDAAEIGTFFCPMPMREIIWNAKCKEHFWLPPDAHIDFELFYSLLHPEDRERTRTAVDAAVFHGVPYDIEYRTLSPSGDVRWIRAKGSTRHDAAGNPIRFDGITIDISGQKRLETDRTLLLERERLQLEEAQKANELKDALIATVSHELRAPLTAILAWIELMERKATQPDVIRSGAEVIRRNIVSQTRLVDDLLDLSRIATGKVAIALQEISLDELVQAELREIRPLAERKGVAIEEDLACRPSVLGDPTRLRQIIANLLGNALKYTSGGGTIRAGTAEVGDKIEISITDTGEGIPQEFIDTIFLPFSQVDNSTTRKHGGLGLGLSIARSLVGMHGGTLRAFSAGVGQGATFKVQLPSARIGFAHSRASDHDDKPESAHASIAGKSVLIVEDDRDALDAFALVFEAAQVTVFTATSAFDARTILAAQRVDAIFSDIAMPVEDGYQLLSGIRAAGDRTPAVAVTAFVQETDRQRALSAGFDEHVTKPVHPQTLLSLLATFIQKA